MTKTILATLAAGVMAISPVSAAVYFSHTLFVDVQSTSDGHGNFTYTFWGSPSNPDFGLYFTSTYGTISIQAYEVLAIQTPPDWQGSVNSAGLVTLRYIGPGGVWIEDVPITFGLSSSMSATAIYSGTALYPSGVASARFTQFGNPNNGGLGTSSFSYIGPVVPEPSATALGVVGIISFLLMARKRSDNAEPLLSFPDNSGFRKG